MKKVILVAIGNDYCKEEWGLPVVPPMGILSVGSFLVANEVPVELIDLQMDVGFASTEAGESVVMQRAAHAIQLQANQIAWVGISQLSNSNNGIAFARAIAAVCPDLPIILGGYFGIDFGHLLRKYPFISAIVRGDGEAAALQISRNLEQGKPFLTEQVPNLAWMQNNEVRSTPVRPVDVSKLPIPDFGLLHNISSYPMGDMLTSRGCPFQCNYCLESCMRPYTEYSLAWVDQQMERLKKYLPDKRVTVVDALFGVGRKRTLEVCKIMKKYNLRFAIETRVDVMTPELLPALAEAGIELIFLGIESASPSTLVRMNKVSSPGQAEIYLKKASGLLEACFVNHVTPVLGLMLGFPGDTEEDFLSTLGYVRNVRAMYDRSSDGDDAAAGFIPAPQPTTILKKSPLADHIEADYPGFVLEDQTEDGLHTISSPNLEMLSHYINEIEMLGVITPRTQELMPYYNFSSDEIIKSDPELTDEAGVTIMDKSIQPL